MIKKSTLIIVSSIIFILLFYGIYTNNLLYTCGSYILFVLIITLYGLSHYGIELGHNKDKTIVRQDAIVAKDDVKNLETSIELTNNKYKINEAIDLIISGLNDSNFEERYKAAELLGKIGDGKAVKSLINSLNDEDSRVKLKAIEALGGIGDTRAIKPLQDILEKENDDATLKLTIEHALDEIKSKISLGTQKTNLNSRNESQELNVPYDQYTLNNLNDKNLTLDETKFASDDIKFTLDEIKVTLDEIKSKISLELLTDNFKENRSQKPYLFDNESAISYRNYEPSGSALKVLLSIRNNEHSPLKLGNISKEHLLNNWMDYSFKWDKNYLWESKLHQHFQKPIMHGFVECSFSSESGKSVFMNAFINSLLNNFEIFDKPPISTNDLYNYSHTINEQSLVDRSSSKFPLEKRTKNLNLILFCIFHYDDLLSYLNKEHNIFFDNYVKYLIEVRKDYEQAESMYRKALVLEPENAAWLTDFAKFLSEVRKDYEQAESMYRKALDLEPENAAWLAEFASFLKETRKDYKQADFIYMKILKSKL